MSSDFDPEVAGRCESCLHEQGWIDAIFLHKECGLSRAFERRFETLEFIGGERAILGWRRLVRQKRDSAGAAEVHLHLAGGFKLAHKFGKHSRAFRRHRPQGGRRFGIGRSQHTRRG